ITDLAGNSTTGTESTTTLTIDTTAATVTNVTSSTDDGIYKTDDNINVNITFSDNVTLSGGTFDITMESGSVDNSISVTPISNTTSVSETYTVQSGDSNALLYVKTLAVTGGYLIDVAGNPLSTTDLGHPPGKNKKDSGKIKKKGIDSDQFNVYRVKKTGGEVFKGNLESTK
ncbi:MAG TPA: hypothetical protein QGH36_07045, partial [Candidatus Marinimicrobia bacterium]|nr:hypothetical protein [Candidatus Neomarinimicrobiota bacterium]